MKSSVLAGIFAALLSIFGVHNTAPQASTAAAAVRAATIRQVAPPSQPLLASALVLPRQPTPLSWSVIVASSSPGLTEAQLDARLDQFRNSLSQQFYSVSSNSNYGNVGAGSPNTIALDNRINNLANVSISNTTVSSVSGLTTND